jgi:ribosomal RNA-processing protein 12
MSNMNVNDFDSKSVVSETGSENTFRSWASDWSACTNATFNKVHRYWRSNSALHKEVFLLDSIKIYGNFNRNFSVNRQKILAVLAAITEVIKENDGQETETEYFAALVSGFDSES